MRAFRPYFLGATLLISCAGMEPKTQCAKDVDLNAMSAEELRTYASTFIEEVEANLRRLGTDESRASWVNETNITPDTDILAAQASEVMMKYVREVVSRAIALDTSKLPPELARKVLLLKLVGTVPPPKEPAEQKELAQILVDMKSAYGKAKGCSPKGECKSVEEWSKVFESSRDEQALREAYVAWHNTGKSIKTKYVRYVELANKGARDFGFSDLGAMWRAGYDMSATDLEADVERLWSEVKPLYEELHCYVRARLRKTYGEAIISKKAPIPAHLLGNMWGQEWANLYTLVEPYAGQPTLDVTDGLKKKNVDEKGLIRLAEGFFTSLGLDALPKTFWERSLFKKPSDREVVCHASAWDVTSRGDLRLKMCVDVKSEDLITAHHELGHNYYDWYYRDLPTLFQRGANDGFHEGIGDAIALSVTPKYLAKIGVLSDGSQSNERDLNYLMRVALDKIAFLPFGKLIDQWRWRVFRGDIKPQDYNRTWNELRRTYQGVSAPEPRPDDGFDAGAKFHVPSSTPYLRYFLAAIYQFQFHQALCKVSGHQGPLHTCSVFASRAAGDKLKAMLSLGGSKPWQEALFALSGERTARAEVILEYFAPLRAFLKKANEGEQCGWQ